MNWKNWASVLAVSLLSVACGGGGDPGTSPYGAGSGSGTGSGSSNSNVTSNTSGSVVLTLSNSTVSASQPGTVTAVVKNAAGTPTPNVIVTFGLSGASAGIAQLSAVTVITDSAGQAATTLTPAAGAVSGAAYVTASADVGGTALTSQTPFSVSATNVTLSPIVLTPASINGYGSSAITVAVSSADSANPVTVNISSTCASAGKAVISPSSLTLTTTSGSVTYQDRACGTTDRINVQISGSSQQQSADLVVAIPATTGIQFVSVDNPTICLSGTGCPSNANVTFKVVDASGAGKAGVQVGFSLDASLTAFADLGSTLGTTGSDGSVSVTVTSKQTPTPLRVTALVTGTAFQTVSNVLTISGGLPVAGLTEVTNGLSFAAEKYALNGNLDGDESELTLRLTDRFGAAAIDGTAVSLVSDGGTVVPAYCVTSGGACTVKLLVSNPRPANGRVHIVAYAKGQEYFVDTNSNGIQNGAEIYDDVPVGVCLDKDEDNVCDAGEFVVGVATNPDAGNLAWDGAGTAFAREDRLFFFSDTTSEPRFFTYSGGVCTNVPADAAYFTVSMGTAVASHTIRFCVRDGNTNGANPIASGSTLAATTTANKITVAVDNSPVPAAINGPTVHTLTITNTNSPLIAVAGGKADLAITMAGRTFNFVNLVTIDP